MQDYEKQLNDLRDMSEIASEITAARTSDYEKTKLIETVANELLRYDDAEDVFKSLFGEELTTAVKEKMARQDSQAHNPPDKDDETTYCRQNIGTRPNHFVFTYSYGDDGIFLSLPNPERITLGEASKIIDILGDDFTAEDIGLPSLVPSPVDAMGDEYWHHTPGVVLDPEQTKPWKTPIETTRTFSQLMNDASAAALAGWSEFSPKEGYEGTAIDSSCEVTNETPAALKENIESIAASSDHLGDSERALELEKLGGTASVQDYR